MSVKIGERVGAILSMKDGVCRFFGYGVRIPDQVPAEAVGFLADAMRQLERPNPCLKLDSGELVYGCECWWGSEETVREKLKNADVVNVSITDLRGKWKANADGII